MTALLYPEPQSYLHASFVPSDYAMQNWHALSELLQRETYNCYVKWFTLKAEQLGKKC